MSQCDVVFDLKNAGHCDLLFHGPAISPYILNYKYLMDEPHTFGKWVSVIQPLPQNKFRSQ